MFFFMYLYVMLYIKKLKRYMENIRNKIEIYSFINEKRSKRQLCKCNIRQRDSRLLGIEIW